MEQLFGDQLQSTFLRIIQTSAFDIWSQSKSIFCNIVHHGGPYSLTDGIPRKFTILLSGGIGCYTKGKASLTLCRTISLPSLIQYS